MQCSGAANPGWLILIALLGLGAWLLLGDAPKPRTIAEEPGTQEGAPRRVSLPWRDEVVAVPAMPRRVIPGASAAVDLLFELELRSRVVALPADALEYSEAGKNPAWRALPRFARFSAEALTVHAPDLVLASPWNDRQAQELLRNEGIVVIRLPALESLEEVRAVLRSMGTLFGVKDRAQEAIAAIDLGEARLAERARTLAHAPRVLGYSRYGAVGRSPAAGTSFDEVLRLAGARNAAAAAGWEGHVEMAYERLIGVDPDVLVVPGGGKHEGRVRHHLESRDELAELRALRRGHIVEMPARWLSANSQEMLTAADRLLDALLELDLASERSSSGR